MVKSRIRTSSTTMSEPTTTATATATTTNSSAITMPRSKPVRATLAPRSTKEEDKPSLLVESSPTSPPSSQQPQQPQKEDNKDILLPKLLQAIEQHSWNTVQNLLEQDPSLARSPKITMVCQGETTSCPLLHLLCSRKTTPLAILDIVITLAPRSLLQTDARGGRLPLHVALVKGLSAETILYLAKANVHALHHVDLEGNLPLHYACLYPTTTTSSKKKKKDEDVVLQWLLQAYPSAASVLNGRDRLPLHLLCARATSLATDDLQALVQVYPKACQVGDRSGRLPLHLVCHNPYSHPQWALLEVLIQEYSAALLLKDKSGHNPLQLLVKGHRKPKYDLIVCSLQEWMQRERKQQGISSFPRPWSGLVLRSKRSTTTKTTMESSSSSSLVDLYHCYG